MKPITFSQSPNKSSHSMTHFHDNLPIYHQFQPFHDHKVTTFHDNHPNPHQFQHPTASPTKKTPVNQIENPTYQSLYLKTHASKYSLWCHMKECKLCCNSSSWRSIDETIHNKIWFIYIFYCACIFSDCC